MTFLEIAGIWFATGMTLFILSFLYKDNPFYRLAEHIFVGITIGYSLVFAIWKVILPDWGVPLFEEGRIWFIIPGALGLMALARIFPKLGWLSRPAFAFVMGYASGVAIPTAVDAFVLQHTSSTVSPILQTAKDGGIDLSGPGLFMAFSELLIVVIVLCILIYFFFSIEHKGAVRAASRLGILFLMIAFGVAYGNTVMGRMALLYNRFFELKENAGPSTGFATLFLLAAVIAGLILLDLRKRPPSPGPSAGDVSTGPGEPPAPAKDEAPDSGPA